jgi:hypothetical protein
VRKQTGYHSMSCTRPTYSAATNPKRNAEQGSVKSIGIFPPANLCKIQGKFVVGRIKRGGRPALVNLCLLAHAHALPRRSQPNRVFERAWTGKKN